MHIHLSGHLLDITDAIRTAVNRKFSRLGNRCPAINTRAVSLPVERQAQQVDLTTQSPGATVGTPASHEDLYAARADASRKLEAALAKRKGTLGQNRYAKPQLTDPALSAEAESVRTGTDFA